MPLIGIVRFLAALLSLIVLGLAAYLLWSWTQGDWIRTADGDLIRVREDWRLWTGAGLLLWSFLGRWAMLALLARPERSPPAAHRDNGQTLVGAKGASLYVETHGPAEAAPIIFTHGWGMDSTMWRYAKADLAKDFRLVLWDLPGLGRSKRAGRKVDLRDFAADLASLALMCERPPVLVGHSIGGMTIQTLVRDHPKVAARLAGVVLLNTTYTDPLRTMACGPLLQSLRAPLLEPVMRLMILLQPLVWLAQWQSYLSGHAHLAHRFGFGKFVTRGQLDQTALLATRNSPAVQVHGNLAMFRWDATGAMRAARIPVLVVGGDLDIVTKADAGQVIATDCPDGRWRCVEGVNHMGPLERADVYNALIADFVRAVQPSPTPGPRSFAGQDPSEAWKVEAPAQDAATGDAPAPGLA